MQRERAQSGGEGSPQDALVSWCCLLLFTSLTARTCPLPQGLAKVQFVASVQLNGDSGGLQWKVISSRVRLKIFLRDVLVISTSFPG